MHRKVIFGPFLSRFLSITTMLAFAGSAFADQAPALGKTVVTGDLNGDNREDSAVGVSGTVYIILQGEHGRHSMITLHPPLEPQRKGKSSFGHSLMIKDLNGDGRQDLVVAEPDSQVEPGAERGLSWMYVVDENGFKKPVLMERDSELIFTQSNNFPRILREECGVKPDIPWEQMNALQKHVTFFDLDGDQRITLGETYRGLRDLGINAALSAPFAAAINGALATPTAGYPTLTIQVEAIAAGIHGSDSGIYDDDGEFVPEVFHQWFQKWDEDGDGALNIWELTRRWYTEADLFDFFGAIASGGEFSVLYLVAAENGKISEARMRGLYDGSLFYAIAADRGTLGCRVPWEGQ